MDRATAGIADLVLGIWAVRSWERSLLTLVTLVGVWAIFYGVNEGVRGARPAWTEGIGLVDTGTPPGVGMGLRPQVWLRPGDVMELGIDGLGRQRQRVVTAP